MGVMFPPDRMIAHNLRPACSGSSELCAYMEREWASTPALLGRHGDGERPAKAKPSPQPLAIKVARPKRARLRIPFL
jgi:hypothetical protein